MKIAAIIKGCGQVGENQFQDYQKIYIFDSAVSIDYILQVTKQTDICACNLSMVEETPDA